MTTMDIQALNHLNPELKQNILDHSSIVSIHENSELLREGQYIKVIPLVISGLIKVYTKHDDKELLLYYIQPEESCIMSFSACLKNNPSQVFAKTEEDTQTILLPVDKVKDWIKVYPELNTLFFQQYNVRYTDLLETIHHVLFDKMDKRLLDYLTNKVNITGKNPLTMSHREIANDLGSAREVISRVMKKLEHEGYIEQHAKQIKLRRI